jgi:hypothetical protein
MSNFDIVIVIVIIVIPLILLVLWYREYVYNSCKNDLKCMKNKLLNNLNNINENIKKTIQDTVKKDINDIKFVKEEREEKEVKEEFIGGLTDWLTGNTSSNLPISQNSLQPENLSILERKINDKMKKSDNFPPTDLQGNSDDFKDSDNSSILGSAGAIVPVAPTAPPLNVKPITPEKTPIIVPEKPTLNLKNLLGSCQFYPDKCPSNHLSLGNFTIQGTESNSILSCGNIINTKPGKAIAQIKNNFVYEIHIIDPGHGYLPDSPPKIRIEGGKGYGATAEAIIDDEGFLKIIKITDKGYNYIETPNVFIDPPMMNSSCHLCCDVA